MSHMSQAAMQPTVPVSLTDSAARQRVLVPVAVLLQDAFALVPFHYKKGFASCNEVLSGS